MGHQNFWRFGYFGRIFGLTSLGLVSTLILPSFADANNELLLEYKFYRVDDDVHPRIVYRIVPSDFSRESEKQGVDFFPNEESAAIYDCDDEITNVDVTRLVETVERCEDKVGGPLEYKSIGVGETFEIEGRDDRSTFDATWNGTSFDVYGVLDNLTDAEKKVRIANIMNIASGVTVEEKSDETNFPSGFSIRFDPAVFDYIEAGKSGDVALQLDRLNELD